jgi:hypothetical protein
MTTKTFAARVVNGQLLHSESLEAFEGYQVRVTLSGPVVSPPPQPGETPEPEPPGWMDVEKDIYVPMPLEGEILKDAIVVEGGPLQPCIVVPEELPDDE